ncbi:MAG: tyrosine--tRNA ligase [Opitutales bacterium]|nr:tyrosine--tRNA ligase [Opitutales bacterium]
MDALSRLKQNAAEIYSEDELRDRLATGRPLRVKLGVDPTRPDLTFGHMVVFNKLRQFQDLGHTAVLIIGDFTTLIGDPSGRSATRPVLTREEIEANAQTYVEQAYLVLDRDKTEVRFNSEWFRGMGFEDCLQLARQMTVARMLERDDFAKRYAAHTPISIVEFLYPLVQGYDSLMIDADVELGGTDQTFNCLVGRQIQKTAGKPEQVVLTLPLLVGTDGAKKMSKSQDNYIAFNDPPGELFGKTMSIGDDVMWDYYRLLLLAGEEAIAKLKNGHPMDAKKALARRLTDRIHGEGTGQRELEQFEKVFSKNELPDEMPAFAWDHLADGDSQTLVNILAATGMFPSKKEARRLIEQGSVRFGGERMANPMEPLRRPTEPVVIQAGKRIFFRVT